MHNGIGEGLPSCIYPIKCLNERFLPYKSSLDKIILLVSTLSILNDLLLRLFYVNFFALRTYFWYFVSICLLSSDIFWYLFLPYSFFYLFFIRQFSIFIYFLLF